MKMKMEMKTKHEMNRKTKQREHRVRVVAGMHVKKQPNKRQLKKKRQKKRKKKREMSAEEIRQQERRISMKIAGIQREYRAAAAAQRAAAAAQKVAVAAEAKAKQEHMRQSNKQTWAALFAKTGGGGHRGKAPGGLR
jgi:hypothetical protein